MYKQLYRGINFQRGLLESQQEKKRKLRNIYVRPSKNGHKERLAGVIK
jgi:hypothetical protein